MHGVSGSSELSIRTEEFEIMHMSCLHELAWLFFPF